MASEIHTSQLFNACHVLFGQEIDVSLDFIRYLQMSGLKAAFRKKALETHPDRAVALSIQTIDLEKQFKEVNAAYRDLLVYVENPMQFRLIDDSLRKEHYGHPPAPHAWPQHRPKQYNWGFEKPRRPSQNNWGFEKSRRPSQKENQKENVPQRTFLFGRYLFYHDLISYKQLIDAIIWQKVQRPMIGNLAQKWNWLKPEEIGDILRQRQLGERFGECALRRHYLTSYELSVLLGRQRLLQPRIGQYFVNMRILKAIEVERMVESLRRHNWKCRAR